MGPRAGLEGRKISPHRDSIPGPSGPLSVAIPTELPGPHFIKALTQNLRTKIKKKGSVANSTLCYFGACMTYTDVAIKRTASIQTYVTPH